MEPVMAQEEKEYGDQVDFKTYNKLEERGKADKYGVITVPAFLFVNEQGEIVYKVVGQVDLETMRSRIEALVSSPK
jgi:thioredoxin-related protein